MSRLVLLDQRSGLQLAGKVHSPSGVYIGESCQTTFGEGPSCVGS